MSSKRANSLDRWAVVGTGGALISLGKYDYPGVAMSAWLDTPGRRVLRPALEEALAGSDIDDVAVFDDARLWAFAEPLRAPLSKTVIGAVGWIGRNKPHLATRPLIGTWEWIQSTIRTTSPVIDSAWSKDQYDLFGLDYDSRHSNPRVWLQECVSPEHQRRISALIEEARTDPLTLRLGIVTYDAITHEGRQSMRLVANVDRPDDGQTWFRGMNLLAQNSSRDVVGELTEPDDRLFAQAVINLCSDVALAVVQAPYWNSIQLSPAAWTQLGLPAAPDASIVDLIHPEDQPLVTAYFAALVQSRTNESGNLPPVLLRFRNTLNEWVQYRITGIALHHGRSAQIVCRFD